MAGFENCCQNCEGYIDLQCLPIFLQAEIKFIDFGLAQIVEGDFNQSNFVLGTRGYNALETLSDGIYSYKSDGFLLGITFCITVGRILILN